MPMPVRTPSTTRTPRRPRPRLGPELPAFKDVELIHRGRMILDVAALDLEAAEQRLGPFHETSWFFRRSLADARNTWDRLRARYGLRALEAALEEPPATVLTLGRTPSGDPLAVLLVIAGGTYRVQRVEGTPEAPRIWQMTRLTTNDDGPYHACRLIDGTTQCDCAQWIYQIADLSDEHCKHLGALDALGWL